MIIFGEHLGSIEAKLMREKARWNEAVRKGDRKVTEDAAKKFKKKLEVLENFAKKHKLFLEAFDEHTGLADQSILNSWGITNLNEVQKFIVAIISELEKIQNSASVASNARNFAGETLSYYDNNILPAIEEIKNNAKKEVAGLETAIKAVMNNPTGKLKRVVADLLNVENDVRKLE